MSRRTKRNAGIFRHQAFGKEVRYTIRQLLSQKQVERCDEMQHERRAAGKENLLAASQVPEGVPKQRKIRAQGPGGARSHIRAVVDLGRQADDFQASAADGLALERGSYGRKPVQHDVFAPPRALSREQQRILTYCPEIMGQPIAEVDQVGCGRRHTAATARWG